jgi:hypothetical protein
MNRPTGQPSRQLPSRMVQNVTASDYARFVKTCIAAVPDPHQELAEDEMYGVYISWCLLQSEQPRPSRAFWTAMSGLGLSERRRVARRFIRPGLRTTGPAAVDYILARRPTLT